MRAKTLTTTATGEGEMEGEVDMEGEGGGRGRGVFSGPRQRVISTLSFTVIILTLILFHYLYC